MMLLIGLAITVAFVASWGATLGILDHALEFWWELALLIVIMLLGHWIEMRSLAQTTSALDSLAALLPDEAERVEEEQIVTVSPADLRAGDVVVVRPGASVPADGRVIDGRADMDESMITGESRPVSRGVGDTVTAGTVAVDSGLRIEVTATGEDTALAGIQRLVTEAQNSSSRAQRLADRAAALLFWFALGSAVITAVAWTVIGDPDSAVIRSITVLVIACPHALGLAIPLVVSIATERAARAGVLVKDRLALESMRTVDTVLFDKTGTLTEGSPAVTAVAALGVSDDEVLALAAAAENASEHPLGAAIVRAATERGIHVPEATDFSSSPAVGVTATVDGREIRVGGPRMLEQLGASEVGAAASWRDEGAIILHVARDGVVIGGLALADRVRQESREAVDALRTLGIGVVMITGDAHSVAGAVGDELGIDRVFAEVRPEDKAAAVRELQPRNDVADRVQARDARLESLVGEHEAAIHLDADLLEAKARRRGAAADGHEQDVCLDSRAVEGHDDAVVILRHALESLAERELDAALAVGALEELGDRLVLHRHEVGQRLDDVHLGAEGAPDARELDTDDAAAEDGDLLRHMVELQRLLGGDDAPADLEARQRARVGAGREDDVLARDRVVADLHRGGGGQSTLALDGRDAARLEQALEALVLARHDRFAVLRDARNVDALEGGLHAERLRVAGRVGDLGRVQHRLCRNASDVQARAAHLVLLDEADAHAELAGAQRGGVASASSSEDDKVKILVRHRQVLPQ